MRQNVAVLTRTLLLALMALPALAEETPVFRLGAAGVVKADLSAQLYQDGAPIADPGVTLVAMANDLDYRLEDLPDAVAGESTVYSLVWEYNGVGYSYAWPAQTRTPQAVVNRVAVEISRNPLELAAGATLPSAAVAVRGLSSDPTGATATFDLTQDGVTILDGVAASLIDVDQAADGTWSFTASHDWLTAETAGLEGSYSGRFTVTFGSGAVIVAPPAPNSLQVVVYP